MKAYYSCTDSGAAGLVPQRLQNIINREMAIRLNGTLTFYVGEDNEFLAKQYNLKARLASAPSIAGIIFFRLQQFNYGTKFDFGFLRQIIAQGYEVHFARESLSLRSLEELDALHPTLFAFGFLNHKDARVNDFRKMAARA